MLTADPLLTTEQRDIAAALDELCDRMLTADYLTRADREARYPSEVMAALAEAGWAGACVPVDCGGSGASPAELVVVLETLARRSLTVGQAFFSMWLLGSEAIDRLGTAEQRADWLPRIARSGANVAFALTEPGSGSDAAALITRATRDRDDFVLEGQKVFITGAAIADTIITAVRTSSGEGGKQSGITTVMVDPTAPGVEIRKLDKMGIRGLDLCEVFLQGARVPASAVLGEADRGWQGLTPGLALERMYLAALCVGALRGLVEECSAHALTRTSFGRPLASHQLVADKLVEMRVALDTARATVKQVVALVEADHPTAVAAASVAKLHASRAYVSACREAVQVFGGYGFTDEYPVSRHYRDCKYLEIGGGSSEIQKIVIGRSMGFRL
ncbi:acyl-CoA dehydrogenase family protein [Nocardioides humi]|uniref:Acyl-CoA dehydrogenase family protein n=1 Tax=Nocardioides humi TaxID=449461 RepID=A0ABN2ACZ0_9ACTN|nr:acyl-CoA dehydrogenase family protein [Nocardioides humi]